MAEIEHVGPHIYLPQFSGMTRYMYCPNGVEYIVHTLKAEVGLLRPSLARALYELIQQNPGVAYLTVPHECPETFQVDRNNFWDAGFYHDSEKTEDIYVAKSEVEAHVGRCMSGKSWIVAEIGVGGEGTLDDPWFEVMGIHYRYAQKTSGPEIAEDVLEDIAPLFTFLVDPPPDEITEWTERLEYWATHIQCAALPIFDYKGLMVWYPSESG